MTYTADPRVDAYLDALPGWQQAIGRQVRDLVHADRGRRPPDAGPDRRRGHVLRQGAA